MMRRIGCFAFLASCLLEICVCERDASAQPKSDTAAQAVFTEGLAKFDHGDFQAACPLLEKAVALSSTPALGGIFTLAECFEKIDKPASAWGLYKKVAAQASADGQKDRAEKARRAADRLEPTLPKVKFAWKGEGAPPAGLSVQYGDDTVPRDLWDVALPANPGSTPFTFTTADKRSKVVTVEVKKGPSVTEVAAPDLGEALASDDSSPQPLSTLHETIPLPPPPNTSDHSGLHGLGIGGIVVGGLGIASMAVSAGVIVSAKSQWKSAVIRDCGGNLTQCKTVSHIDSARSQGNVASALFGVGVGLTVIGTGILVADLVTHAKKTPTARSVPNFAFGGAPLPGGGGRGAFTLEWKVD